MTVKISIISSPICQLGESPVWDAAHQILYWVDVKAGIIYSFNTVTRAQLSYQLPCQIGCIALYGEKKLLCGLTEGLAIYCLDTKQLIWKNKFFLAQHLMINDGHFDSTGRFWFGTKITNGAKNSANIYQWDEENNNISLVDENYTIANGLIFSPNEKIFYVCDSPQRIIYQYTTALAKISERRIFTTLPQHAGFPDGLAVDTEGCIWNAEWDGACLTRYHPNGKILEQINLPVLRPTSCCFGGEDLKTLYITTASEGLTAQQLALYPNSGKILSIQTQVPGY